jgi:ribonuclease P protein component
VDGPLFTLWAAPTGGEGARLGLAASRRLGGAVARNRAKRLLRDTFRRAKAPAGLDLVLVPKKAILKSGQAEVDDEYQRSLRRLARTSRKPGGERPAAAD